MTHAEAIKAQFLPTSNMVGMSVEKTFKRQVAAGEASKECAAENRRRRKAYKAWFKVKEVFDSICPEYIPVYTQNIWLHP
jgi:hypothetical protein